jgi:ferredoxin
MKKISQLSPCNICINSCPFDAIFFDEHKETCSRLEPKTCTFKIIEDKCNGCGNCAIGCRVNVLTKADISIGRKNSLNIAAFTVKNGVIKHNEFSECTFCIICIGIPRCLESTSTNRENLFQFISAVKYCTIYWLNLKTNYYGKKS